MDFYKTIDSLTIECLACNHFCKIQNGKAGVCGVRINQNGILKLLVYGRAVAMNVDPIEKKPLFHFLPGSKIFSLGTVGCNFRCGNCQNFDISQIYGMKGDIENYSGRNLGAPASPEEIIRSAIKEKCACIAYTYNEPSVFIEYAYDTMKLARDYGFKNVWVSNGYTSSDVLSAIAPYLDAINVDIKSFDENFYQENCGARLEPVLENCRYFVKKGIWLEITTLVIPGLSDDLAMLEKLAKFIKSELADYVPWHVSAFSSELSSHLKHLPDTSIESLEKAYKIGKDVGLKYVYVGNAGNKNYANTNCPNCGALIIKRKIYNIQRFDKSGACPNCQYIVEGVF